MLLAAWTVEAPAQGPATLAARRQLEFTVPPAVKAGQPRWVVEWSAGLEEAERRNVPLIAVLSDEGAGFQSVNAAVYAKPGFAAFSRQCVLLAAFDGRKHGATPRKVDGQDLKWCNLFGGRCEDHLQSYLHVQAQFARREFWNPLQVFVAPDGEELGRVEGHKTTQEKLDEELALTRDALGPGLDYGEYQDLMVRLRAITDARDRTGHANAHTALARLLATEASAERDPTSARRLLKTPAMKRFVERLRTALLEEGDGLIADAEELVRRRDFDAARKLLGQVQRSFSGLAPGEAAARALAALPPATPEKKKDGGPPPDADEIPSRPRMSGSR